MAAVVTGSVAMDDAGAERVVPGVVEGDIDIGAAVTGVTGADVVNEETPTALLVDSVGAREATDEPAPQPANCRMATAASTDEAADRKPWNPHANSLAGVPVIESGSCKPISTSISPTTGTSLPMAQLLIRRSVIQSKTLGFRALSARAVRC